MALLYRDKDGNETPIAGTQVTGELVPSISHYKSGTFAVTALAAGTTDTATITFDGNMPDADYVVVFNDPADCQCEYNYYDQTASGFKVRWANNGSATMGAHNVSWQAFKLMTEQSYQLDSDQIAANKINISKLQGTQFINYSLNAFYPITDTSHNDNWTASFTRSYIQQSETIPSGVIGDWFNVIQWNSVQFASQIWVNSAGNAWSRFRYRVGGASSGWGDFRRLDNDEIKNIDAVQDWTSILQVGGNAGSKTCKAKRFGDMWHVCGSFYVDITPSTNSNLLHIGYSFSGHSMYAVVANPFVSGYLTSQKWYDSNGDTYVGLASGQFNAGQTYRIYCQFQGLVY